MGTGEEIDIFNLAMMIATEVGYPGDFTFAGGPDGMGRKMLDSSRAVALGWKPQVALVDGIRRTIKEYREGR